jgi:hypothetical protein
MLEIERPRGVAPTLAGKEFIDHERNSEGKGSPKITDYVSKRPASRRALNPKQLKNPNKKRPSEPKQVQVACTALPERAAFERRLRKLRKSNPEQYRQIMRRMGN